MKTEIIRFAQLNTEEQEAALNSCAEVIKAGGLVVFPTETVYGLGACATSSDAAKKIYAAKGRPSDNPLIIHVADPLDAEKYAYINDTYRKLAEKFMPGPLTVVLIAKDTVPLATRGGLDTVAVRCPSNLIARRLIESGTAIAAPSANISGSPSATCCEHVIDDMSGRVDYIIDGGKSEIGLESTIVRIDDDGGLTMLRPGKITVEELLCAVPRVTLAGAVTSELSKGEVAQSPGMKYRHYAPKAPLVLLDGEIESVIEYVKSRNLGNIAIIAYEDDFSVVQEKLPSAKVYNFGGRKDAELQARELFLILRDIDKNDFSEVYAPLPAMDGLSLAIYNRMIRAAAHTIIKV